MTTLPPAIQALPKQVVDRIAAGEVVQRPASVVKELVENSLDAKSSSITVHFESASKLSISDNGCGIRPVDLGMAATRFATSKFRELQDFDSLSTFGFRGEALASVSLVSRLSIASRIPENNVAYLQNYDQGKPLFEKPKPQARPIGTTVSVKDLFYNLPHRQQLKERDEYQKVLSVVQAYAIHSAARGISLICKHKQRVDVNTTTLVGSDGAENNSTVATERVLQHVYGSKMTFTCFDCQLGESLNDSNANDACTFVCNGMISTSKQPKSKSSSLVLFVNDRLVECPPLKKLVGEVLSSSFVLYVSIIVPPTQVDVNVHPTKKQVTLLYQDEILSKIQATLQALTKSQPQSFTTSSVETMTVPKNPYKKKRKAAESLQDENDKSSQSTTTQSTASSSQSTSVSTASQRPNSKIRTSQAAPAGALEPYLVARRGSGKDKKILHVKTCPLSDLSQPGAFSKQCSCPLIVTPNNTVHMMVRPKRITPTCCRYKSIQSLRKKLLKYNTVNTELKQVLNSAIWVGHVSDQSRLILVQCGVELCLWNVRDLLQQLFYQLALLQFGGLPAAGFKQRVDVTKVIQYALDLEENEDDNGDHVSNDSDDMSDSSTNYELASQAATCLMNHADLLDEYFSIRLEQEKDSGKVVYLTALPVLLQGYEPSPGGLSVFLLRLATKVNWTEEKPCFHGIMRELGHYYSDAPFSSSKIQHSLFPAISFLLTPTPQVEASMQKLTVLSNLYKAFER